MCYPKGAIALRMLAPLRPGHATVSCPRACVGQVAFCATVCPNSVSNRHARTRRERHRCVLWYLSQDISSQHAAPTSPHRLLQRLAPACPKCLKAQTDLSSLQRQRLLFRNKLEIFQLVPVSAIAQCSYGSSTESQLQRCRAAVAEQLVENLLDVTSVIRNGSALCAWPPAEASLSTEELCSCSCSIAPQSWEMGAEVTVMLGTRLDIAAWEPHRHKNIQWPFERNVIAFRRRDGLACRVAPSKGYHTTTYLEHLRRTKCLASALSKWGVKLEDRVATLMWNSAWHYE